MHPRPTSALFSSIAGSSLLAVLALAPAAAACPSIWLIGDSQTVLYGTQPGVGLIAQRPEWCIEDLARGGETSAGALTRIAQHLDTHPFDHPDVAVVLYGENDRVQAYLETVVANPACANALLSCPLPPTSFWHPDPAGERIFELVAMLEEHGVGEILLGLPLEGAIIRPGTAPDHVWQANRWLRSWAIDLRKDILRWGYRTVNFRLTQGSDYRADDPFHQSDQGIAKQVRKASRVIAASLRRQGVR